MGCSRAILSREMYPVKMLVSRGNTSGLNTALMMCQSALMRKISRASLECRAFAAGMISPGRIFVTRIGNQRTVPVRIIRNPPIRIVQYSNFSM